ncbi:hypothetical protein BD779DRAFT_1787873 [Infundibulicybe gibba]|nr:hypothetical protein BD779DRAFT_1787873 [Infundibulicybe gibba]
MPCPNCHCPPCLALAGPPDPSTGFALPPPEVMTKNRTPTNSEMAHSLDIIRFIEKTIPKMQVLIDDLEKRKAELLNVASAHKATISPLRTFPPELLARIFMEFVAMTEWRGSSYQSFSPFLLMGVCSQWRRIVLHTPQLWTRIAGAPPMIDSWITHSKELPFDLELDLVSSDSYPILKALIPYSHRWEHINFSLGPDFPSVLARARTRLHSLKTLKLSFDNTDGGTVDFCEVAPQLTEIDLAGIHEPVVIQLPWEQLVVCTLDNSGLALYVLQHATNLRTFHLDMANLVDPPWLSTPRDPHSYHQGLENLTVRWSIADPSINSFFSSITLPSLRTLDIDFDSSWIDDIVEPADLTASNMSGFFERSCKHLTTLRLAEIPVFPDDLMMCLALTPSLVSLDIHFGSESDWLGADWDELLAAFDVNLPGYILPCLRSLSFRGHPTFSEELLDDVIASRRDINPTDDRVTLLESLTLECSIPSDQSTSRLPQFHRFVSGGLNITYERYWDIYNSIQAGSSKPPRVVDEMVLVLEKFFRKS